MFFENQDGVLLGHPVYAKCIYIISQIWSGTIFDSQIKFPKTLIFVHTTIIMKPNVILLLLLLKIAVFFYSVLGARGISRAFVRPFIIFVLCYMTYSYPLLFTLARQILKPELMTCLIEFRKPIFTTELLVKCEWKEPKIVHDKNLNCETLSKKTHKFRALFWILDQWPTATAKAF